MTDGMSDASPPSDDFERDGPEDASNGLARRSVLHATVGAVGAGGLLLGMGSAGANGKGGQAVVLQEDFDDDQRFVISEVADDECSGSLIGDGSCFDGSLFFQCHGEGRRIPFPYWHFQYVGEGETRRLYTRDNSIETGITYRWSRKAKDCPETSNYFQVGFTAGGTR